MTQLEQAAPVELPPEVAAQIAREETASVRGVLRYNDAVKRAEDNGQESSTATSVKLIKSLLEPVAEEIQRWADGQLSAPRSAFRGRVVLALGTFHTAYLTCQHIINSFGDNLNAVVHRLGADIEDNLNMAVALKLDSVAPLIKHLQKTKYKGGGKNETTKGLDRARRRLMGLPSRKDLKEGKTDPLIENDNGAILNVALSSEEKASIGHALIDLVVHHIARGFTYGDIEGALFEIRHEEIAKRGKYETVQKIYPTELYLTYKAAGHKAVEALRPCFEPMRIKPQDWTDPYSGGYLSIRMPVIKGGRANFLTDAHTQGLLNPLYDALNALQSVGWKYNEFVAETMKKVWDLGMNIKAWPRRDEEPRPAKPAGCEGNEEVFKKENPKAWYAWKEQCSEVERRNASKARITKLDEIENRINYALEAVGEGNPTFYEVFQADFRLRIYPVSSLVHSQGNDQAKALMLFAEGKAIDEEGARWLRIQVANTWANDKLDKKLYEEREAWVFENEARIYQAGTDPMADLWWLGADKGKKPWCFLAACREYALWLEQGVGFVSHLPVSLDGSCNGIQHYAALLRDAVDGALVNLRFNGAPQDLYSKVVERTQINLAAIESMWAPHINRDVAKRPTMTYGYSATLPTFREQIATDADYLFAHLQRKARTDAVSEVASQVDKSIKEVVSSAAKGMRFLQTLAADIASKGLPVVWTTPDGCLIQQEYIQYAEKRVRTVLNGAIKVKADKGMLVQHDLVKLPGFNLDWEPEGIEFETKTQCRKVIRDVKALCVEKRVFNFYRSEVDALLETYSLEYNFEGLANLLIEKHQLAFDELQTRVFKAAVKLVIKAVMDLRHLRESDEETEEVDQETGEIVRKRGNITIAEPTDEPDVKKAARGIGPNYIHSLDAAHMRMTVRAAVARGVTGFMMVHDSYGCHAADVHIMERVLREEFVKIHTEPRLELFGEEMVRKGYLEQEVFADARKKHLKYGDLDVTEVLDSPYFFG